VINPCDILQKYKFYNNKKKVRAVPAALSKVFTKKEDIFIPHISNVFNYGVPYKY
jgi:hypothetical protein